MRGHPAEASAENSDHKKDPVETKTLTTDRNKNIDNDGIVDLIRSASRGTSPRTRMRGTARKCTVQA